MNDNTPIFVAETDSKGEILCVWCKEPSERFAKPINDPSIYVEYFTRAAFHGASPVKIRSWLKG